MVPELVFFKVWTSICATFKRTIKFDFRTFHSYVFYILFVIHYLVRELNVAVLAAAELKGVQLIENLSWDPGLDINLFTHRTWSGRHIDLKAHVSQAHHIFLDICLLMLNDDIMHTELAENFIAAPTHYARLANHTQADGTLQVLCNLFLGEVWDQKEFKVYHNFFKLGLSASMIIPVFNDFIELYIVYVKHLNEILFFMFRHFLDRLLASLQLRLRNNFTGVKLWTLWALRPNLRNWSVKSLFAQIVNWRDIVICLTNWVDSRDIFAIKLLFSLILGPDWWQGFVSQPALENRNGFFASRLRHFDSNRYLIHIVSSFDKRLIITPITLSPGTRGDLLVERLLDRLLVERFISYVIFLEKVKKFIHYWQNNRKRK